MKIVVFGTGYVGSAIVRELADRGHEVTAVSRSRPFPETRSSSLKGEPSARR